MFLQTSLFGMDDPTVDTSFADARRIDLDGTSWVEFVPGWLSGADRVFDDLRGRLVLRQKRNVVMYDSVVDEPRLSAWWHEREGDPPLAQLDDWRAILRERYDRPFDSVGFNLYRDGNDSVAWHGDRHRKVVTEPIVAILSVGAPRQLRLRPRGGGESRGWALGQGDLFVMGGACQHDWEHCVPKTRRAVGPRLSITFRHDAR